MGMKKIVLAILCILFGTGLKAEIFLPFRHIGIRDGLPDNYVKNVFGLPDGRLGIRTTSLLSFYDGKNFINYPLWKVPEYGIVQESVIPKVREHLKGSFLTFCCIELLSVCSINK